MFFIREATINDVQTIRRLAAEVYCDAYAGIVNHEQLNYMLAEIYSAENITSQIKEGTQTYLLLIDDELPVAFAAYSPREEDPDIYKLHKLYCLPITQGKGYGKALINAVIDKVLSAGKHILELNVNRRNKARLFYEKLGFQVLYEEDIPVGPYFMTDYVMRKELDDVIIK